MTLVYIIRSEQVSSRRYIGLTENLGKRLLDYNTGKNTSTFNYRPWRVECCFYFVDEEKARRFERYLKSGAGRAFAKRHF